jgi:hypothetical protein
MASPGLQQTDNSKTQPEALQVFSKHCPKPRWERNGKSKLKFGLQMAWFGFLLPMNFFWFGI